MSHENHVHLLKTRKTESPELQNIEEKVKFKYSKQPAVESKLCEAGDKDNYLQDYRGINKQDDETKKTSETV